MKTRNRVLAFDYDGCLADHDNVALLAKINITQA